VPEPSTALNVSGSMLVLSGDTPPQGSDDLVGMPTRRGKGPGSDKMKAVLLRAMVEQRNHQTKGELRK
jgi:hypothetical protein